MQPLPAPNQPPPHAYDYSQDPFLQQTYAQGRNDTATAKQTALDQQKKMLLGFGSQQLARSILGDDPFVGTVSSDPANSFSTLANIARGYAQNTHDFNEQENADNLWFSTARSTGLGDLAKQRLQQEYEAQQALQEQLGGTQNDLNSALATIRDRNAQAEQDAYQRALDEQAQFNYGAMTPAAPKPKPKPKRHPARGRR